jgi:hypothetical protein
LLFRLFCSAATHYLSNYVFLVKLHVEDVYSYVLISEQGVVYTLRWVASMKHELQYNMYSFVCVCVCVKVVINYSMMLRRSVVAIQKAKKFTSVKVIFPRRLHKNIL